LRNTSPATIGVTTNIADTAPMPNQISSFRKVVASVRTMAAQVAIATPPSTPASVRLAMGRSAFVVQPLAIACTFVQMDRSEIVNLWRFRKTAKGIGNQSKWPQYGQGASPAGVEGSIAISFPQTGQRFGRPSGVLDEGSMLESYLRNWPAATLVALVPCAVTVGYQVTGAFYRLRTGKSIPLVAPARM